MSCDRLMGLALRPQLPPLDVKSKNMTSHETCMF